jgi:hypothetical protein
MLLRRFDGSPEGAFRKGGAELRKMTMRRI